MRIWIRLLLFLGILLTACLCFSQKTSKASAKLAAAKSSSSGIDVEHSSITVHVLRGGVFGFTGDNHEIHAPISKGKMDAGARSQNGPGEARPGAGEDAGARCFRQCALSADSVHLHLGQGWQDRPLV